MIKRNGLKLLDRSFLFQFIIIFVIWASGFLMGYKYPDYNNSHGPDDLLQTIPNLAGSSKEDLFIYILKSNSSVLLVNVTGYVLLGIPSIISSFFNGFVTSLELNRAASVIGWERVILVSSPHSIELIGIWLAGAIGLRGFNVAIHLFRGGLPGRAEFIFISTWLIIAMLLITIAAFVEGFISTDNI